MLKLLCLLLAFICNAQTDPFFASDVANPSSETQFCFDSRKGIHPELLERLVRLQYTNCSSIPLKMSVHSDSQGFGVQFVSYYSVLSQALKEGKTFYLEGNEWNYAGSLCGDTGWNCFFKFSDACQYVFDYESTSYKEESVRHAVMLGRANLYHLPEDVNNNNQQRVRPRIIFHNQLLEPPEWIIDTINDTSINVKRWWEAQMATLLFCPKEEIIHVANEFKQLVDWKGPVIAMHIRRGDRYDLHKYTFDDYMSLAVRVKEELGINRIFLASDDNTVFDHVTRWQNDFTFYYLTPTLEISKLNYQWNNDTPSKLAVDMLIDLYLLSECNVFIGAQRSMFGWVASRLIYGKGNEIRCPLWVGNAVNDKYGYWQGNIDNQDVNIQCV